jgi:ubiquitin C-terminal hydrolase
MKAKRELNTSCTGYLTIAALYMVATTLGKLFSNLVPGSEAMNLSTGKWYDCNDSWVKPISGPDSESASAYVLFYV